MEIELARYPKTAKSYHSIVFICGERVEGVEGWRVGDLEGVCVCGGGVKT